MQYDYEKNMKKSFKEHLYDTTLEMFLIKLIVIIFLIFYYFHYSAVVVGNFTPIYTRMIPITIAIFLFVFHSYTKNKYTKLKATLFFAFFFVLFIAIFIECLVEFNNSLLPVTIGDIILVYFVTSLILILDYKYVLLIYFLPLGVFTAILAFFYVLNSTQKELVMTIYPVAAFCFIVNRAQYRLRYKLFKANYDLENEEEIILQRIQETTAINDKLNEKTSEINKHHKEIKERHKGIDAELEHAKIIQLAMFPKEEIFRNNFADYFIFYLPLNKVSGDFYWAYKTNDVLVYATADSTGHGVPGALISMLGISLLDKIVRQNENLTASEILELLRIDVKKSLNQTDMQIDKTREGMDIALCVIDLKKLTLQFSGANNSLYIVRNQGIIEFKADRQPIAIWINETEFTNYEFQLQPDDLIYSFSDGYYDQFNEKGKKYRIKRFKEFLLEMSKIKSMDEQKKMLIEEHQTWKGKQMQIDDIVVLGVRI